MSLSTPFIWTVSARLPSSLVSLADIWGSYTYYSPSTVAVVMPVTYYSINYPTPVSSIVGANGENGPAATVTGIFTALLALPVGYTKTINGQMVPSSASPITVFSVKATGISSGVSTSIAASVTTAPSVGTTPTSSAQSGETSAVSSNSSSASATTTTTISSHSSLPKNQYSTGEFAGIAIACFVGGLLIAGFLSFLLLRKRRSHQQSHISKMDRSFSEPMNPGPVAYIAGGAAWEKHLPQSESDNTIRNLASRTLDQVELHVENYYRDATASQLNADVKSEIERLDAGHLATPTVQLIQQTHRPIVVIKHCIASLIISKITTGSRRTSEGSSFLPADFISASPPDENREVYTEAASRWRVLTSYLRPPPEHDATYQRLRDQAIMEAAHQVRQAFGPWARGNDNARHQNLVNIMTRASEFGVTLFAQPASFEWQWENARSERDNKQIVALPGLYKTVGQDGRPLAAPLRLLEARLERV